MKREVGIIGAGISGLVACKYVRAKGFSPIVFEAKSSIGGAWTQTLETTKLQTPKSLFQFSDFPWPPSVTQDHPDHRQVLSYITDYAHHFDLIKHIKFNTLVQGIHYEGPVACEQMQEWHLWGGTGKPFSSQGKWSLSVKNDSAHQVYTVDFVILCIGRFSDVPNIPDFPPNNGPEIFGLEKVIHSMDYASMDSQSASQFVKGKQVTVVGFQKSALDITMECSTVNGIKLPCRVLYRTKHWNIPDFLPWGIPLAFLYLNRFSELMVHKPHQGFLLTLLATLLAPIRWAFSIVESHIRRKVGLTKFGMVPTHSFHQEVNSCSFSTLPENFYDKVDEGSIILKKAPRFWFCKEGLMIDGEVSPLKTDLVILATGFRGDKKLRHIFISPIFQNLIEGSPNAALPLYRECIHPQIPQLAVIGFSESASNLYTSEIRCRWIAELLNGTFQLPSIKAMKKDVEKWDEYLKKYSGKYYRRSCIAALHVWYNDQLCKDMGWNSRRKKGILAELFEPYGPMDYCS